MARDPNNMKKDLIKCRDLSVVCIREHKRFSCAKNIILVVCCCSPPVILIIIRHTWLLGHTIHMNWTVCSIPFDTQVSAFDSVSLGSKVLE